MFPIFPPSYRQHLQLRQVSRNKLNEHNKLRSNVVGYTPIPFLLPQKFFTSTLRVTIHHHHNPQTTTHIQSLKFQNHIISQRSMNAFSDTIGDNNNDNNDIITEVEEGDAKLDNHNIEEEEEGEWEKDEEREKFINNINKETRVYKKRDYTENNERDEKYQNANEIKLIRDALFSKKNTKKEMEKRQKAVKFLEMKLKEQEERTDPNERRIIYYKLLIFHYTKQEGKLEKAERVLNLLLDANLKLDIDIWQTMIAAAKTLEKAEEYMKSMREQGVNPNSVIYAALLKLCRKLRKFPKVEIYLEEMKREGVEINTLAFLYLMNIYIDQVNIGKMRELFDQTYRERRLNIDVSIINLLIEFCLHQPSRNIDVIHEIRSQMSRWAIDPNLHTFSALLRVYARHSSPPHNHHHHHHQNNINDNNNDNDDGKNDDKKSDDDSEGDDGDQQMDEYERCSEQAERMLDRLIEEKEEEEEEGKSQIVITRHLLISIIDLCSHLTNQKKAKKYVSKFISHYDQPFDLPLCNGLLSLYSKLKDEKQLLKLIEYMTSKSIDLDITSYTSVIQLYCKLGDFEKAEQFFNDLIGKHLLPNLPIFNALLTLCCDRYDEENLKVVFNRMRQFHLTPDLSTFSSLICSSCYAGNLSEAEFYLREMLRLEITPDHCIFQALVTCYCKAGDAARAEFIFHLLHDLHVTSTHQIYHSLLLHVCGNDIGKAEMLIDRMIRVDYLFPTPIILHQLITICHVGGCPQKVEEYVERYVRSYHIIPKIETFHVLLRVYVETFQIGKIEEMYEKMKEMGVIADFEFFYRVIEVYANFNDTQKVIFFFNEFVDRNVEIRHSHHHHHHRHHHHQHDDYNNILEMMISFCKKTKNVELANKVYDKMVMMMMTSRKQEEIIIINSEIFYLLFQLCVQTSNFQMVDRYYQQMVELNVKPNTAIFNLLIRNMATYDAALVKKYHEDMILKYELNPPVDLSLIADPDFLSKNKKTRSISSSSSSLLSLGESEIQSDVKKRKKSVNVRKKKS